MARPFKLGPRATKRTDANAIKRARTNTSMSKVSSKAGGKGSLLDRIAAINATVLGMLGDEGHKYQIISQPSELASYISSAIENGILSYDTETNSLDPLTCTLAGVCLFTPGQKPAYVPMHHVSYVTGVEIPNQFKDADMIAQLRRLDASTKLIMHNGKFDLRVTKNTLGVDLSEFLHWDSYIAAHLLNENEPKGLKALHSKYCGDGSKDKMDYDSLFSGIPFTHIPIKTGYLYAAKDALVTYELFKYQEQFLGEDGKYTKQKGLERLSMLFRDIEMPLVPVLTDMQETGVHVNVDYAKEIAVEYTENLAKREQDFHNLCEMYSDKIKKYRYKNPGNKLGNPISVTSPKQLAELVYDVLEIKSPDKYSPRSTKEEILEQIDTPITKAILAHRKIAKLLSTYIIKIPNSLNAKTGKIHANFNQVGTDTGRLSSSDPNLQNIPSKDKKIRPMFVAGEGKVLISSDYSQQEPRILAQFSQDANLLKAYNDGKDIYAFIGSKAFKVPYEECLEVNVDGTSNPAGKKRRDSTKSIVLGIMYSRGARSIAEQINVPLKDAEKIIKSFNVAFPQVQSFVNMTIEFAQTYGYVETIWGRKRRIPDMLLDSYYFEYELGKSVDFDPLCFDIVEEDKAVPLHIQESYICALNKARGWKQANNIKEAAREEGIIITDNTRKIEDAIRKCVNSRIQGTAADMVKLAMVNLNNDKILKELECRLIMQVHDEVIAECPRENALKASQRMSQIMIECAATKVEVPMKCDVDITEKWYGEKLQLAA